MKNSLRRLTIAPLLGLATAALLAGGGWYALNRTSLTSIEASGSATPAIKPKATFSLASDAKSRDSAGNSMLADAILSLERRPLVSAKMLQKAHCGGLQIIGEGKYFQQGTEEQRKTRSELRADLGGESATLIQIVDNRFLWIDQSFPTQRRIERVDLWRLRRATGNGNELPHIAPGDAVFSDGSSGNRLYFGGLPMLLEALRRNFDFSAPRLLEEFEGEQVYALRGVWKPEKLCELLGVQPNETTSIEIPPRVPLDVLVYLGSRDYFPFMIQYRAVDDPAVVSEVPTIAIYQESERPLMLIKLYQVSFNTPINPDEFVISLPEGVDWIDATSRYIDRVNRYRNEQLAAEKEKQRK